MANQDDEFQSLTKRVEALEMTCGFQERALAKLDEVVRAFADRVDELEGELRRLDSTKEQEPIGPQDDPPPHY